MFFFMQPDPLAEALDSVVGDHDPKDGSLESAELDAEVFAFPC